MSLILETKMRSLRLPRSSKPSVSHDAARRYRLDTPQSVDHAHTWTLRWNSAVSAKSDLAIREARTTLRIREGAVLNFKSFWCHDDPSCGQLRKITSDSLFLKFAYFSTVCLQADCLRDDRRPRRHCVVTSQATERLRRSGHTRIAAPLPPDRRQHPRGDHTMTPARYGDTHFKNHTSEPRSHAARRVRPHSKQETHAARIQSAGIVEKKVSASHASRSPAIKDRAELT